MSPRLNFSFWFLILFISAPFLAEAKNPPASIFNASTKVELVFKENVKGLGNNFSGVDYVVSKNHYFILDDDCRVFEVKIENKAMVLVRTVLLNGFKDCEAIVHLPSQSEPGMIRMAVAEERRGTMVLFDLKDHVPMVARTEAKVFHVDKMTSFLHGNSGLEAMAVDDTFSDHPMFYFGKEEFPRRVYHGLFNEAGELVMMSPWDAEEKLPKGSDIAELYFVEGKLLVLDQRGSVIRQVHPKTGDLISELKLPPSGWSKYEGMTVFRRGPKLLEMMLVAEKHVVLFFYIKQG